MRSGLNRSRRVIRPTTTRTVGRYPSLKANRTIHWESQLERDQIYLLEFDPNVITYFEQPEPLRFEIDGTSHKYTPDFYVERNDGRFVIEVKPFEISRRQEWREKLSVVSGIFEQMGVQYVLATEREIRAQPRLDNVGLFLRYQRYPVDDHFQDQVIDELTRTAALSLHELSALVPCDRVYESICSLIARGLLEVDLMQAFTRDIPVQLRKETGR